MTAEDRIKVAKRINEANLGWTADSYTSTEPLSLAQTISAATTKFADGTKEFDHALSNARKYLSVPVEKLQELDINEFEPEWNWENVSGYDFTGRILD